MQIIALIHREDDAYGISFPDLPGCISAGSSLDEVLTLGQEALALHLEGLAADGAAVPPFRTADAIQADPDLADILPGAILATLPVHLPGRSVKVTITMEEQLLARLNRAAEAQGTTRSGFIADAVRQRLTG